ncbi:MAG: DUF2809 domain-containing protein [Planctomycetota bacterium]|nr:DUF2809 domain-containing protein [Planctomycetota bacterium]
MTTSTPSMRMRYGASLMLVLALGIASQAANGTGWNWVARQLGGAFYVLAGVFLVLFLWPRCRTVWVCLGVLLATVLVEFAQLWHPGWLQALRGTRPGGLLLGSTFHWADFPYYFLGCGVGLVWTRWIAQASPS